MEENEEIKKDIDDVEEDHREEGESIDDDLKQEDKDPEDEAIDNEIAEDHREEGESLEDLKNALKNALYENSLLKEQLARTTKERDEAHNAFLRSGRDYEEKERNYASIVSDIR